MEGLWQVIPRLPCLVWTALPTHRLYQGSPELHETNVLFVRSLPLVNPALCQLHQICPCTLLGLSSTPYQYRIWGARWLPRCLLYRFS
jgi:hypothetical protein